MADVLRQVLLETDAREGPELGFEQVHVLLLAVKHVLEQLAAVEVADLATVRDGPAKLIDGAVYTSQIAHTKPAPEAFRAVMDAVGAKTPEHCVFVGDRLFDDIYGAKNAGMRAILVPHSDIPNAQVGHTEGEPDAVIHTLADLPDVIAAWR